MPEWHDSNRMKIWAENQEIYSHSEKEQPVTPFINGMKFIFIHQIF